MLFTPADVAAMKDIDAMLEFRTDVERVNSEREPADVELFVATALTLTAAAIAVDSYLHRTTLRPTASPAKQRLRWALDHVTVGRRGEGRISTLSEATYLVLTCFLKSRRTATVGSADTETPLTGAVTAYRQALGPRAAVLDIVIARIAEYAEFDADREAARARTIWQRLDELEGEPPGHGWALPPTDEIDADSTLAAISNAPADVDEWPEIDSLDVLANTGPWERDDGGRLFELLPHGGEWSAPASSRSIPGSLGIPADSMSRLEHATDESDGCVYRVWYGTNRAPRTAADSAGPTYSAAFSETISTGACVVRIPRAHRVGSVGRGLIPAVLRSVGRDARLEVIQRTVVDRPSFLGTLRDSLSVDADRSMLVYIHGFNTEFDEAARRTAQIAFDLRFTGPAVFYSWPSKGRPTSYHADLRDADASVTLLADFLVELSTRTDVDKLHVVAHSMGNRIFGLALENIANRAIDLRLGELVLAAPDLDSNLFGRLARVYPRLSTGTTLYVSRRDQALALSGKLWAGTRVGFAPPVTVAPQIDTVDVRSLDLSLLGHGYVATHAAVLTDIEAVLRGRRPAGARMRISPSVDGRHWVLR